ncbi:hypothetical protein HF086_017595 [Spodoptera exigua]|uniref:Uncharacterized protein n=1 Tax=Spodoptera exigua TaxID=7107 RepID=A0A922SGS4_SPOEX|nr:hypothetical protein HF086_017595 [Spodoptera exigua]
MRSDLSRVSSLLEKYIDSNAQMIKEMNASIVEVKSELVDLRTSYEQTKSLIKSNAADITAQIQNVQSTTTQLTTEQCHIKSQLTQFENKIVNNQNKIQNLETNISKIQLDPHSSHSELSVNEQIFREIQDRNRRQNNIIIVGISEQVCINTQERILKDESDVLNVITSINSNITKPYKIFRIGKYSVVHDYQQLDTQKSRLSFLYLNARSICKKGKLDELKCIIKAISTVHIIVLTETWIQNDTQALQLQIPNYTHYYNYRTDIRGGGVSAYIHNDLKHNLTQSTYQDGNNYLWVYLEKFAIEVGVVYNPGDTNIEKFWIHMIYNYKYENEQ